MCDTLAHVQVYHPIRNTKWLDVCGRAAAECYRSTSEEE